MSSYRTLEKVYNKLNDLERSKAILHWDMATMMPAGGAEARIEQLTTLETIAHAILTDEGIGDLLSEAKKDKKLNEWQSANLLAMQHRYNHAAAVPQKLVSELSAVSSECELVWRKARQDNDFKAYAKELKKVVALVRDVAKHKSKALGCSPYDALLDTYDPGMRAETIDPVFDKLKAFLPEFIKQVSDKQKSRPEAQPLKGAFTVEKQKALAEKLLGQLQFDTALGRLDESVHPFCTGYATDVRITTRYDEKDFTSSLMGVMHEGGHALYEQNLPSKWLKQPAGQALGMSVHESQSLLIEMQACRSREFISYLAPIAKKAFGGRGKAWEAENFYSIYSQVKPSLIRVDADEVTYPAHILLRYYIERYLIDGEMEVDDLPDAWAQGMEKFLGIKPDSDANGCMQDIHWADGTFGYFPSYTIGAIYAAQQFDAAKKANGEIPKALSKGDFSPLITWMQKNIHRHGQKYETPKLMEKATGSKLNVDAYIHHLKDRYLEG